MNKFFKRLLMFFAVSITTLSSCSSHHKGKGRIEDIVGIYQLTTCNERVGEDEEINLIEDEEIKCFLLINGTNFGYAYYKDKNTSERLESVYVEYEINEEASSNFVTKYSSISYYWGEDYRHSHGYHPGFSEPALGIWEKSHTLSYSQLSSNLFNSKRNHINVTYTRISSKLSFNDFISTIGISIEIPDNFLIKKNKGKIFTGYTDQIKDFLPQYQNIKIVPNLDYTKYKILTLAAGLEDIEENYVESKEYGATGMRNISDKENLTDILFEFQLLGDTVFGLEPKLTFITQKKNSSYAEIRHKIGDNFISFWGTN